MRKTILLLFCIISTICQSQELGIIPTPQSVEIHDGHFSLKEKCNIIQDNDNHIFKISNSFKTDVFEITGKELSFSLKAKKKDNNIVFQLVDNIEAKENINQAYNIEVTENNIYIRACSYRGLFYGSQSLKQLIKYQYIKNQSLELPCCFIIDYPNIEYRGWMDDISRGPIPTTDFIKKEIRRLSEYKLNFFNLYTEHLFILDEYPDIAPSDGLSAEEIKELTEYAKDYYIEFIGNQQCFAHAEKTLDNPFYNDIKDTRFNFNPSVDETYEFLETLLGETAQAYESKFFNINCDETESLGNGNAKSYVDSIGNESVYCQHISKVYNILQKYNKEVMMWGDIIAKNPEMIKLLPDDIQFIVWSYGGRDDFNDMIKPFKESGHTFWIAPGASMWASCFPNIDNYIKNIANFARDGYKNGTKGIINTAWDDYGESMFNEAWHAMVWCGETSWNTLKTNNENERLNREKLFNENFSVQYFEDYKTTRLQDNRNYLANLYELNKLIDESDMTNPMNFTVLNSPLLEFYPSQLDSAAIAKNEAIKKQAFNIYLNLLKDRQEVKVNTEIIDVAILAAYRAYIVTLKNELRINLYKTMLNPTEENVVTTQNMSAQFLDSLHLLKKRFVKAWNMESRSYYRDVFTARYDKIAKDVLNVGNYVFIETTRPQDHKTTSNSEQPMVSLKTIFNDRDIYYTTDGSEPDKNSKIYTEPFAIERSCIVKARCFEDNSDKIINEKYILYHKGMGHFRKLNSVAGNYRPEYSGGGEDALLDGAIGSNDYKDGNWQGFYGTYCDIELDFDKKEIFNSIKINFITNPYDWIMMPKTAKIFTSDDGNNYIEFKTFEIYEEVETSKTTIVTKKLDVDGLNSRYIRITIETPGIIPEGLPGYNNPSWMFMDEIIIN